MKTLLALTNNTTPLPRLRLENMHPHFQAWVIRTSQYELKVQRRHAKYQLSFFEGRILKLDLQPGPNGHENNLLWSDAVHSVEYINYMLLEIKRKIKIAKSEL